ncbi:hypothetical protein TNCV_1731061 [Trichonephila clavipes]|nr:hypothetical protein TNCV_1731061 [Trichonephila clavipes]
MKIKHCLYKVCVRVVLPFSKSRESVSDSLRSRKLEKPVSHENIEKVIKLITKDRQLTVRMIIDELQIDRESVRQIVTQNLRMKKTRVIVIDDIPSIQRNVMRLLNSNPKEDFLQSFQDMYSRSQRCIVMRRDYFEGQ